MRIVKKDPKHGKVVLRVEVADDLYYLADLVVSGDVVISKTQRRGEKKTDVERAGRSDKETVTLGVEISKIEFDANVDRLRLHGVIVEGPDHVPRGDAHTLNVEPGMVVTVLKSEWGAEDWQRLKDSEKTVKASVLLVAMDERSATLGRFRNYGVKVLGTVEGNISGKDEEVQRDASTKAYYDKLAGALVKEDVEQIIVAGPGFAKDAFKNLIEDKNKVVSKKIFWDLISTAGEKGLQEILHHGVLENVVKESKISAEIKMVQQLFEEIGKDTGLGVYGFKNVEAAANYGAIETLLIISEKAKEARRTKEGAWHALVQSVEAGRGRIMLVSSAHEEGKRLEGLGGIAALLRFKVE